MPQFLYIPDRHLCDELEQAHRDYLCRGFMVDLDELRQITNGYRDAAQTYGERVSYSQAERRAAWAIAMRMPPQQSIWKRITGWQMFWILWALALLTCIVLQAVKGGQ